MYFKNFWFCYVKTKAMYFFIWWYICYSGIFTVVVYLLYPFGMGLPFLVVLLCGGQSNVLFYAVIYSRWWYIRCGGVFAACIWDGASLPYCGAAWGLSVRPCSSIFSWVPWSLCCLQWNRWKLPIRKINSLFTYG